MHSKSVEILCLGSSHAYFGINPDFISPPCFNAAHPSQSLKYDFEIVKKYQDKWESLKVIVIPVDYFSLFSEL